jgi:hypothetical protein
MRKYRGLTKEGEWVYGSLLEWPGHAFILREAVGPDAHIHSIIKTGWGPVGFESFAVLPATVGQSTGLKDKNGQEIFEGDIIDFNYNSRHGNSRRYNCVVERDTCNPCFVAKEICDNEYPRLEYDFIICELVTLEIIGNVHQPELLEAQDGD